MIGLVIVTTSAGRAFISTTARGINNCDSYKCGLFKHVRFRHGHVGEKMVADEEIGIKWRVT